MNKQQHSSFDWGALGWAFLFFWFFSGVLQTLIQITGMSVFVGFRQAVLVSLLWLVPLVLWPQKTKSLALIIGVMLWLTSIPALAYFLVYHQEFSQSIIYIIFESNLKESGEYLQQYFSWWIVLALLAYTAVAILLWRKLRPINVTKPVRVYVALLFFITSVGYQAVNQTVKAPDFAQGMVMFQKRLEPAAPFQLLVGYVAYRQQLANMQELLASNAKVNPLGDLTDATEGVPTTLVLVIGESTNRQRMEIYGYHRNTTPELERIKDQLVIFDNVVTPIPHTIEALERVLTFADEDHPNDALTRPTLMNMMKQAGYKTYWITNQQTLTQRNTMLTVFSKQADEQVYLNNNREQNSRQYDEVVFEPFMAALAEDAPKKFIVIHLLGTHLKYEYRYPKQWEVFDEQEGAPGYLSRRQLTVYNSYDNAVLYNDYVLSQLIKQFAASQPTGFLLYLSDHGEAVYDSEDPDMLGRNAASPTSDMYTVPFLLWRSPKWQAAYPRSLKGMESRPYNTENFIYTWADLAGIQFKGNDKSRSIVSDEFIARPFFAKDEVKSRIVSRKSAIGVETARAN